MPSRNSFDDKTSHIYIKGDKYMRSTTTHDSIYNMMAHQNIPIKWYPGVSMHKALALAAKLGIDHVRNLLLVAGNTFDPFDRMVSLCHDLANMTFI